MKRFFIVLCTAICFISTDLAAQEVRGVETKVVEYSSTPYEVFCGKSGIEWHTEWFGYSFSNMNSIPVSVEAELYIDDVLEDTKSFVLNSKETYIWKQESRDSYNVYDSVYYENSYTYRTTSFVKKSRI